MEKLFRELFEQVLDMTGIHCDWELIGKESRILLTMRCLHMLIQCCYMRQDYACSCCLREREDEYGILFFVIYIYIYIPDVRNDDMIVIYREHC